MQKRWLFYVLVALLILSFSVDPFITNPTGLVVDSMSAAEVDEEVAEALDDNLEVRVIVKLKKDTRVEHVRAGVLDKAGRRALREELRIGRKTFTPDELEQKRMLRQGFAAEITEAGLEKLQNDPAVESIEIDEPVELFLSDSVPLINANDVWNTQLNNMNITGMNQAICIIDTGVDYTHESIGGCTNSANINTAGCSKVLSGYDFVNDDDNPIDDHGHGTHVAGIAAGNGTVVGVAPAAQIIAMKVLNSGGGGFVSDVVAAIEWCTYNATKFNITVVSMSLGGSTTYSSDCDSDESSYTPAIDAAAAKNISVVVAAGNAGSTTSISAPACVHNVTSVGWTSKQDVIASATNAGAILDVVAPGSSIVSANDGGGTVTSSGTSMSTPHVAGAYALVRHYYQLLAGKSLVNNEAEHSLKSTGVLITDTRSGANNVYVRIDAYAALIYLNASPRITFVSPTPDKANATRQTTIIVNITSDKQLAIPVLEFDNVNYSMSKLNDTNYFYSVVLADGLYNYRVYANDSIKLNMTDVRTVRIDTIVPNVSVLSPSNGSNHTSLTVNLNFTFVDSSGSSTCILTNSTGQNTTVLNCANTTFVTIRGLQNVTLYINDTAGNVNATTVFFNVNLPPQLVIVQPQNATYGNTSLTLNFTATDEDLSSVWYNLDDGTNSTVTGNVTFTTTAGQHVLSLFANDTLNQLNKTKVMFSVDAFGPDITFVAPTPNNETYNTTNIVRINITLSENGTAVLEFGGANESMSGLGTSYYVTKEVSDGNYSFRVYANDTSSNPSVSIWKYVTVHTVKNHSSFFQSMNATNAAVSALRLLRGWSVADAANVSLLQNYTLEFNRSGVLIHVADFRWSEANTAGLVNVTQNVTVTGIETNIAAHGGVLNQSVWIELNNFVSNYTPRVVFDKKYRLFYYINGTTASPTVTRITTECATGFVNRPCYALGDDNSTMYLVSFSGASAGSDVEFPTIMVSSPTLGASLTSTSVTLSYVANDNVAVDTCMYQLNSNANSTLAGCGNTTVTAAEGSNTIIFFVNDTSGNRNGTTVTFTVSTSSGGGSSGSSGAGGGGGGGSGGSSSGRRTVESSTNVVTPEVIPAPSVAAVGGVAVHETKPCVAEFGELSSVSLVAQNNARGTLQYKGTCALTELEVRLDSGLEEQVVATSGSALAPDESLEILFERNGRTWDKIPALMTGNVVNEQLTRLTARAVETARAADVVTGNVIVEGVLPDGNLVRKEIPVQVSVFAAEKAVVPAALGSVGMIMMGLVGLVGLKKFKKSYF